MINAQPRSITPFEPITDSIWVLVPDATGNGTFDPELGTTLGAMFDKGIRGDVSAMKAMLDLAKEVGCAGTFRFTCYGDTGPISWLSPFHLMTMGNARLWNYEIAAMLLDAGHSIDDASHNGTTPLMSAAITGDVDALSAMLAPGANVDLYDRYGRTALSSAAAWGETDCVKRLLAAGANPNLSNHMGEAPCDTAATCGFHDIAALLRPLTMTRLKAEGTDPYSTLDDSGYSILHCLAEMGLTANVHGITHSVSGYKPPRTHGGLTPAHIALLHGFGQTAVAALGVGGDYEKLEPLAKSLRKKGFKVPSLTTVIICEISGTPHRSI